MKTIKVVVTISLLFLILFSALPIEHSEYVPAQSNSKVTGLRCMFHIYRSFHIPFIWHEPYLYFLDTVHPSL